jgi:hypothetical protein
MIMTINESRDDRIMRVILGVVLIGLGGLASFPSSALLLLALDSYAFVPYTRCSAKVLVPNNQGIVYCESFRVNTLGWIVTLIWFSGQIVDGVKKCRYRKNY